MGNWNIVIEGAGVHDNGPECAGDADKLPTEFVSKLLEAGHAIKTARFELTGKRFEPGSEKPHAFVASSRDLLEGRDLVDSGYGDGHRAKRIVPRDGPAA